MKVIVTGGSGLIGRALVAELAARNHQILVLTRQRDLAGQDKNAIQFAHWDGETIRGWSSRVSGAHAVIHLAGESIAGGRWTASKKRRIVESRVRSTEAVAQAILEAEPKPAVLLQASAVGYYGPRGDGEIDEQSPPGDDFLAETCRSWEAASAVVEVHGVRRVLLRTGVVLSTAGGALPKMMLPFRLFAGGPLGSGRQWLPWIHIADQVGAILWLLDNDDATGPYNLTAPSPLTNRDFGRALGQALHRPSFLPTPGIALRLALGEMADLLLKGQRAVPARLLADGYSFRFPQADAALGDLLN